MTGRTDPTTIVSFSSEHLDAAVQLSQQAGWPHRHEDWQLIMDISDGIAVVDGKEVTGTGFTTAFGPDVAVLNMIIVKDGQRRQGIGQQIMQSLMQKAGDREQRLVATESGVKLYEKIGFIQRGQVLQQQGPLASVSDPGAACWCNSNERDAIVELDTQASAMVRGRLIDALMAKRQIAVIRSDGKPTGFAALRRFGHGHVVGPVVAADIEQAKSLLSFLFAKKAGEFMRVDCDETTGLADWLNTIGLSNVNVAVRMTFNAAPNTGLTSAVRKVSTYALASQALG